MNREPVTPISEEEPRHCPACGARVAELATTCLMCGASLAEGEERDESTPRRRVHWLFWVAAVGVSALVLGIAVLLLRPFIFPEGAALIPTSTSAPTPTATPTATSRPTHTPTITPTPTPIPPRAHQVRAGETLASIASEYDTTTDQILALNPGVAPELLQVGQVLLIPPAIPTPGEVEPTEEPTPLPTPEGDYIIHVVAPGDTLLSISQQYSVTIALIRVANPEIPPGSDVIQVNQPLVIPVGTPVPTPTPTPDPNATPTPLPTYPVPPLLSPPDDTTFGGPETTIVLQWASVGILRPNEWYELHVARPGEEPVVVRTRATAYRMPAELYPQPDAFSHRFSWWVRVVREVGTDDYEQASVSGPTLSFTWLEELPTPTVFPNPM